MGLVGSRQFAMLTLGMSLPLLFSFQLQAPPVFFAGCATSFGRSSRRRDGLNAQSESTANSSRQPLIDCPCPRLVNGHTDM